MKISGLQKLSLIDYPDKVAAVVFAFGCNFRCGFCHNPELTGVLGSPASKLTEKVFFDFLEKRKNQLDGVCVTGGEPTLQKDLPKFLRKIKNLGFAVKLDTNGTHPEVLEKLIKKELVDYVAMDIKEVAGKYDEITGTKVNLNKIQKSAEIIKKNGADGKIDYEFRTTILPKFHKKKTLIATGKWLMSLEPAGKVKKYFLQNFRPEKTLDTSLKNKKSYSSAKIREFCCLLKPYFEQCEVRG